MANGETLPLKDKARFENSTSARAMPADLVQVSDDQTGPAASVTVVRNEEVPEGAHVAAIIAVPGMRHAFIQQIFGSPLIADTGEMTTGDMTRVLGAFCEKVEAGDTSLLLQMLTSQAVTLDVVATNLLRKAASSDHMPHIEALLRLGMKAQAGSRANVEALTKIMRGGEQVVRHVHVNEGGQAVIAGTINQRSTAPKGEGGRAISEAQSDAAKPA